LKIYFKNTYRIQRILGATLDTTGLSPRIIYTYDPEMIFMDYMQLSFLANEIVQIYFEQDSQGSFVNTNERQHINTVDAQILSIFLTMFQNDGISIVFHTHIHLGIYHNSNFLV
jgi:hypothetical protein